MTNSQGTEAAPAAVSGGKRERLVAAARRMFHEQGVEKTTLAEIAAAASVPAGNVFYYFKTKDALVSAVLETYGDMLGTLYQTLDQHRTPRARLKALVRTWARNGELLAGHGCPIGSLTSELGKREDPLRGQAAAVLSGVVGWAQVQFAAMGRRDARELALALVSAYEGVALLANALQDPGLVATECRRLERWIDSLVS